jgi:folate-binding protein YgfZ
MPIAHLTDRAVIAVEGEAARPFLHNLLTQDIETLAPGQTRFAALLTPQGRILHDMLLVGTETGVLLDVAASAAEDLTRRLTLYRLRAKVTIALTELQVHAAWGDGADPPPPGEGDQAQPGGGGFTLDPRTPLLGSRALAPSTASRSPSPDGGGSLDDYNAHRLAQGVPDVIRDTLHDRVYPLEADYDLLHAIDFKKGCFVGQETTSRMHRRGTLKTRLLPLAFDGSAPPPGAEVLAGDLRAGETLSGVEGRCLALLRLDRIAGPLTVDGRPVRVDPPAWFLLPPTTASVVSAC